MAQEAINKVNQVYQRPWGSYQTLALAEGYQAKLIKVNPQGRLSLQKHFKRSEHWVVVQGEPRITVDDQVRTYQVGESVRIPLEAKHRLENLTDQPVAIIEVQIGNYLGEDDIQRFDDIYGRTH
jgi:mannose-6-phosphate isomerase-like protein (cupin superfamily)